MNTTAIIMNVCVCLSGQQSAIIAFFIYAIKGTLALGSFYQYQVFFIARPSCFYTSIGVPFVRIVQRTRYVFHYCNAHITHGSQSRLIHSTHTVQTCTGVSRVSLNTPNDRLDYIVLTQPVQLIILII